MLQKLNCVEESALYPFNVHGNAIRFSLPVFERANRHAGTNVKLSLKRLQI
jgi:hypothetical protein